MATLEQQIAQQTQSVRMLEKMVQARRATPDELSQALERLELLKNPRPVIQVAQYEDDQPPVLGRIVGNEEYLQLQSDLSKEADHLNRQMAELSNQLYKVPQGVGCPEIVGHILALKARIESIWDQKRYLERNKCLPPEPEETPKTATENSPAKFELAYRKRRLVDLRSKLNRKLDDPKAKPAKMQAWQEELVRTTYEIQEIDSQLATL